MNKKNRPGKCRSAPFRFFLFAHKEDTERARPAVAGHRAARMRFNNFVKRAVCRRLLHRRVHHALLAGGVRDEGKVFRDVFAPVEALLDILTDTLFERAAVLFANAHLPLAHFDAGLEVQEVRAKRSHSGAAPALSHVVEPLDEEACLHLRRKRAHALGDLAAGKPLRGELCRRHDQKSLPAAQVL